MEAHFIILDLLNWGLLKKILLTFCRKLIEKEKLGNSMKLFNFKIHQLNQTQPKIGLEKRRSTIEMSHLGKGKLVRYQVSDMSNTLIQPHIKALIRLLIESLPKTFTWTPAVDHEGKAIEYKRKLVFSADFCWN